MKRIFLIFTNSTRICLWPVCKISILFWLLAETRSFMHCLTKKIVFWPVCKWANTFVIQMKFTLNIIYMYTLMFSLSWSMGQYWPWLELGLGVDIKRKRSPIFKGQKSPLAMHVFPLFISHPSVAIHTFFFALFGVW